MDQTLKTVSENTLDELTALESEAEQLNVSIEIELEDVKTSYSYGEARPF